MTLSMGTVLLLGLMVTCSNGQFLQNILGAAEKKACESTMEDPHMELDPKPKDADAEAGSRVELTCGVFAVPQATIRWERNGEPVQTDENVAGSEVEKLANMEEEEPQILTGITVSKLIIPCLQEKDEGTYTCIADNGCSSIVATADVKIKKGKAKRDCPKVSRRSSKGRAEGAAITMWTEMRLERVNVAAQLFCRATGYPKPSIKWEMWSDDLDDYTPVSDDENHLQLNNGDLLVKAFAEGEGGGIYRCTAANNHGNDQIESVLVEVTKEDE